MVELKNFRMNRQMMDENCTDRGKYSWIISDWDIIKKWFGFDFNAEKCLKVLNVKVKEEDLFATVIGEAEGDNWGTLGDMIISQNLMAMAGLAPRIYDLFMIYAKGGEHKRIVLIEDYIDAKFNSKEDISFLESRLMEELNKYPIKYYEQELSMYHNYKDGKYLDFHGFKIDIKKYEEDLFERIRTITHFGKNINGEQISYQETKEFPGKRKTEYRKQQFGDIDFTGKSVLDIGCNLGLFLHWAHDGGANKMTGYDKGRLIQVAREYANIKHKFNIDFYEKDLSKTIKPEKHDIVFYLAMEEYFGIPDWLINCVGEIMYFEGNASTDRDKVKKKLEEHFKVTDFGFTTDRSDRCLFKCEVK